MTSSAHVFPESFALGVDHFLRLRAAALSESVAAGSYTPEQASSVLDTYATTIADDVAACQPGWRSDHASTLVALRDALGRSQRIAPLALPDESARLALGAGQYLLTFRAARLKAALRDRTMSPRDVREDFQAFSSVMTLDLDDGAPGLAIPLDATVQTLAFDIDAAAREMEAPDGHPALSAEQDDF